MFERFKAYKKLSKSDKFLKGCKVIAELTNDEKLLKEANEALYLNAKLRKEMWYKRKMAVSYNFNLIKYGL